MYKVHPIETNDVKDLAKKVEEFLNEKELLRGQIVSIAYSQAANAAYQWYTCLIIYTA